MLAKHREKSNSKRSVADRSDLLVERRREFRAQPGHKFVPREVFCELLLSCKKLVRSDEPAISLRGLLDVKSGERYLIEQEKLFSSC
jgi:hypothetical protein